MSIREITTSITTRITRENAKLKRNLTFDKVYVSITSNSKGDLKVKKEFWAKRIALVALTGLISSGTLIGCQENEITKVGTSNMQEAEGEVDIERKEFFVPKYALLEYELNGKQYGKVVSILKQNENKFLCKSVTEPDFVVSVCKNNDEITYNVEKTIDSTDIEMYKNIKLDTDLYAYVQQYCEFGDGVNISKDTILKIEEGYLNKKEKVLKFTLAENANGDWKEYLSLHTVAVCRNEEGEKYELLVLLETDEKDKKVYRSLTNPEISVVEIYDENGYFLKYELQKKNGLEKQNEEFTKQNEVLYTVSSFGAPTQISYKYALWYEQESTNKLNEENSLGR